MHRLSMILNHRTDVGPTADKKADFKHIQKTEYKHVTRVGTYCALGPHNMYRT